MASGGGGGQVAAHMRHLVIPGQTISTTGNTTDAADAGGSSVGFLRGHGTHVEFHPDGSEAELHASHRKKKKRRRDKKDDEEEEEGEVEAMENEPTSDMDASSSDDEEYDVVTGQQRSMHRHHCTPTLHASVSGTVERVNKLVSVNSTAPMQYRAQVGDLVVGRITSVGTSRWRVHLGPGCRSATLPLSGVNLPGGVQRIRTAEDARAMRTLFREGDLVSAEVQQITSLASANTTTPAGGSSGSGANQNTPNSPSTPSNTAGATGGGIMGNVTLHTRSLRYGKLENGCVLAIPPLLIPRMKHHFVSLPSSIGVDVILGKNGFVWMQRTPPEEWTVADVSAFGGSLESAGAGGTKGSGSGNTTTAPLAESLQRLKQRHASTPLLLHQRENLCRVRNVIQALATVGCAVQVESIVKCYKESVRLGYEAKALLRGEVMVEITRCTREEDS